MHTLVYSILFDTADSAYGVQFLFHKVTILLTRRNVHARESVARNGEDTRASIATNRMHGHVKHTFAPGSIVSREKSVGRRVEG